MDKRTKQTLLIVGICASPILLVFGFFLLIVLRFLIFSASH